MAHAAAGEGVDDLIGAAIRKRDLDAAFRLLVANYGARVYSLCCRMLKDRGQAEEVMQESYAKAFQTIDQLREPERLRAYVMQIATHLCLDILRTARRRGVTRDPLTDVDTLALARDLLDELASTDDKRAIEECLQRLPPDKRAAVLGRFFADLPYQDLARAMNKRAATIRIAIARILPALRDCLEEKGVSP